MLTSKPEKELCGQCDMLFCMINFKVIWVEHAGDDTIYYDHRNKHISLKKCAHVRVLEEEPSVVFITMINESFITLRTPTIDWPTLLIQWISYIRQIPQWQISPDAQLGSPQSWAKMRADKEPWELVYLKMDHKRMRIYSNENPMGSLVVQQLQRDERKVQIGIWTFKFETCKLARAWFRLLSRLSPETPRKLVSAKREGQKLIDTARQRNLRYRRNSIGDEWEDSEEDEEAAYLERVMQILRELSI